MPAIAWSSSPGIPGILASGWCRIIFPKFSNWIDPAFPSLREIEEAIGPVEVQALHVPADCRDGFFGAYWRRPEQYLDARVRAAISVFSKSIRRPESHAFSVTSRMGRGVADTASCCHFRSWTSATD